MEEATTSLYTDMMNKLLFYRKKCGFLIFLLLGLSFYGTDCTQTSLTILERLLIIGNKVFHHNLELVDFLSPLIFFA
jgi:hypothetical protein